MQGTELFQDAASGPADGNPGTCVGVGSLLLWAADGGLWSSDGTTGGTALAESLSPRHVASTGSLGYFTVGNLLYTTDGLPGNAQPVGGYTPVGSIARLDSFGNHVFFHASSVSAASDGTAQGTVALPGRIGTEYVELGGKLFFQAMQPGANSALWSTDGTVAGTGPVTATPAPGGFGAEGLFAVPSSGEVFYSANSLAGRELFASDGTAAGTGLVANIAAEGLLTLDSSPTRFVEAAGLAFFVANDGLRSRLYRTNGTTSGTGPVFEFGADQPQVGLTMAAVGTRVFFAATDAASGTELWVASGVGGAAERVLDIVPGAGSSYPRSFRAAEDRLFFTTMVPPFTRQLWHTTGDAAATVAVPGIASYLNFGAMASFGRGLVVACNAIGSGVGEEPYYTDGTQQGTVLLGDFVPGPASSDVRDITQVGDLCFFTVDGEDELVVTDGTVAGTVQLTQGMSDPPRVMRKLTAFDGRLVFQAYRPAEGVELWVSDGTVQGTHVWFESVPGADGLSAFELTPFGDVLLLNANIGGLSRRMYRTDGTAAGTFALSIEPFYGLETTGDRYAYFSATGAAGLEVWRTDGTVAGTGLYADVLPGTDSSTARYFAHSGGKLLFSARHRELGVEPWVLDLDASHQPVGFGCSADGTPAPQLRGADPVLGATVALEVSGGPEPGLSLALLSPTTTQSSWIGIGYCQRFVQPNSLGFHMALFAGGRASHPLVIPNTPSLEGVAVRSQALVLGVLGIPAAELSNGVNLSLGY